MKIFRITKVVILTVLLLFARAYVSDSIKVYNLHEIILKSRGQYKNPYKDCWIELRGHDFQKKIYGFLKRGLPKDWEMYNSAANYT